MAAVARSRELSSGLSSSASKMDSETKTPCSSDSFDFVTDVPLAMDEEGETWHHPSYLSGLDDTTISRSFVKNLLLLLSPALSVRTT